MAVGLNFGKQASKLLEQGAATSTSAMAIGGAVVGGAYEGIAGDGDMLGGAIMGAGLGAGAKFASNMYSIGAKSANSGSFKLSNFTDGYEQASRRNAVMGLGFSTRGANKANMNTGKANASNPVGSAPSANATTSSTSSPYVPPTAQAGASVQNSAKQAEVFNKAKKNSLPQRKADQAKREAEKQIQREAKARTKADKIQAQRTSAAERRVNRRADQVQAERTAAVERRESERTGRPYISEDVRQRDNKRFNRSSPTPEAQQRMSISRSGLDSSSSLAPGELSNDIISDVLSATSNIGNLKNRAGNFSGLQAPPSAAVVGGDFRPVYRNGEYQHPQYNKISKYERDSYRQLKNSRGSNG